MPDRRPHRTPARRRAAIAAAVTTTALATASVSIAGAERTSTTPADDPSAEVETAVAERRDLATTEEFAGALGHGDATALVSRGSGTLTALPEVGDVIRPGEMLYEVDERPVVLLAGDTPMWRPLGPNVDDGRDVAQLEQAMVDLGFADDDLTVDGDWTWLTTRAVEDWQEVLGVDEDGTIDLGEVVFAPQPVRVSDVPATLGGGTGGEVLSVTAVEQLVTLAVSASDLDLLPEEAPVTVTLPDGSEQAATVTAVGAVPDENDLFPVTVALDQPVEVPDASDVTVAAERVEAEDVLAVPVTALVALLEGGYAVEAVDASGATDLIPVQIGSVLDGWVEVAGDITAGDRVVTG